MRLRTSDPLPCESLTGFLRRLADLNAYKHVGAFLGRLELRYGRRMIEDLPGLAAKLGVTASGLREISPRARPTRPALEWRFQRSRCDPVCPDCIADGRIWQQAWRHSLVTACPEHKIRLQAICPRCWTSLAPGAGGYQTCECGLALEAFPRDAASDGECQISGLISGVAGAAHPAPFVGETPLDIANFLYFLSTSELQGSTAKPGKTPLPRTVEDAVEFIRPVANFLADWPVNFDAHVRTRLHAGPPDANSAPERLGAWYQRLMKFRAPAYEPFRARVGEIINETFEGAYAGALADSGQRSWVSAAAAARDIGVRAERLVAEVANGRVPGRQHHSGLGHRHTQVPAEAVEAIKVDRERFFSAKAAAEHLGVGKKYFMMLREAGLVVEIPMGERPPLTDGGFDRDALTALVSGIRDSGRGRQTGGKMIPFREISLRRTTDRAGLLTLLRAVANGEIRPSVALPEHRLGDILFDAAQISEFLETAKSPKPYTALEVAEITGWKHECVTHWCKQGLLHSTAGRRGGAETMLIRPEELAEFQCRYAVVADMARMLSTSSRHLLHRLQTAGVPAVGAKAVDGSRRCLLVDRAVIWSIALSVEPGR